MAFKASPRSKSLNKTNRLIQTAKRCANIFEECAFTNNQMLHSSNNDNFRLQYCQSLQPKILEWALNLTRQNVAHYYNACKNWQYADADSAENYSDLVKRNELTAAGARFILVFRENSERNELPIGFVHIRFVSDRRRPVLYIYEIQIEPSFQQRGLGVKLLELVMKIAWHFGMKKCMLTSFKANIAAQKLYKDKLRFLVDESSPKFHVEDGNEEIGYEILSITKKQSMLS